MKQANGSAKAYPSLPELPSEGCQSMKQLYAVGGQNYSQVAPTCWRGESTRLFFLPTAAKEILFGMILSKFSKIVRAYCERVLRGPLCH